MHSPVASSSVAGFSIFGRLATPKCVTRPNRVRINATARMFAAQGFASAIARHLRLIGYLLNG